MFHLRKKDIISTSIVRVKRTISERYAREEKEMAQLAKKAAVLAMAGVVTATAITGCGSSIDTEKTVMTVGKEEVPLGVANFYARFTQGQYETYYAGMMGTTPDAMWDTDAEKGKTYEETVKEEVIDALTNLYVISQHAAEYEVTLTDEDQNAIKKAAEQFDAENSDEVKQAVSGYRKDIEKYLELVAIQSKMLPKMQEGANVEVTDEEAAQKSMDYVEISYNATDETGASTEMTEEEKTASKEKLQSLADRVKAGESLEEVAAELGLEVKKAAFDSQGTTPSAELVKAADALAAEGDVTEVVESASGVAFAKITSMLDREATDQKKASIVEQRKQEQYNTLLEKWKKDTKVTVKKNVWKKVDFSDHGVTILRSEEEQK